MAGIRKEVAICSIYEYRALHLSKDDIRHEVCINRPFAEWTSDSLGIKNHYDPLPNNAMRLLSKIVNHEARNTKHSMLHQPYDKKTPDNNAWRPYFALPLIEKKL
jgi:hypothetical protein